MRGSRDYRPAGRRDPRQEVGPSIATSASAKLRRHARDGRQAQRIRNVEEGAVRRLLLERAVASKPPGAVFEVRYFERPLTVTQREASFAVMPAPFFTVTL